MLLARAKTAPTSYNNQANVAQNKARGDFDRPHRLVVSYAYEIPVKKSSFMDNAVFRDWTISGIVTYQKGLPFSVTDTTSGGIFGSTLGTAQFLCGRISEAYTRGTTSQSTGSLFESGMLRYGAAYPRAFHH